MMPSFRLLLLPMLLALAMSARPQTIYPADKDTAYSSNSGITTITLDSNRIKNLTNLGMLWGFIKYYHAGVAAGKYNMDAELFRVLPKVLAATTQAGANAVMEDWVDHFRKPQPCPTCKKIEHTDAVKLMPDYGYLFDTTHFSKTIINKLAYIRDNRTSDTPRYYVHVSTYGLLTLLHEKSYNNTCYPDAGIRLLAAYRYWNTVQYCFPDRHLIGSDWNKTLSKLIPLLCNAKDSSAYVLACMEMVASIHDTHANLSGSSYDRFISGNRLPNIKTMFIDDKLIVVGYDDTSILREAMIGDVIERIDNIPVATQVQQMLPYVSASNYSRQLYALSLGKELMLTTKSLSIHLTINRDGRIRDIDLPTNSRARPITQTSLFIPDTGHEVLAGNIGYIFPGKLKQDDISKIKQEMDNTKGIIIDLRCYPSVYMPYSYAYWLKCGSSKFEQTTQLNPDIPGMFEFKESFGNGNPASSCYKGRIVIIVNQATVSQAEYTTMALATAQNAMVIGDTTAGADGEVVAIVLPGNLTTRFSGRGYLYPDGRETQRIGIKIDKMVRPTIAGIRARKDEQLEAAIKIIEETK